MEDSKKENLPHENILIKYSSLFKTYPLNDFYENREKINNWILNKYDGYITIFLYIKNENDEILHTLEIIYNTTSPKRNEYFQNKMEKFYNFYYQYTKKSNLKNLFISYCIIPHYTNKIAINYKTIMSINEIFIKIGRVNKKTAIFENIRNNFLKYLTGLFSIISFIFTMIVLSKIDSLPMQTINFELLPLIISPFLIISLVVLVLIILYVYFLIEPIKNFLFLICPKKYILRLIYYNDLKEFIISFLFILFLLIGIKVGIPTISSLSLVSSSVKEYIIRTQIPQILKIKNKDLNTSQNILYLGSDEMINYFTDKDINLYITKDEILYKNVCMGIDTGYIDHLMPLIEKKTFGNKVFRRVQKRDISIINTHLGFQDTFCFNEFPKLVKKIGNDNNETVLLMGVKKSKKNKNDINYGYYDESQIREVLSQNPQFKEFAKNKEEWIKNMMREEVFVNIKYKSHINATFDDKLDINISNTFY